MAYSLENGGERKAAARDLAKLLLGEARRLALQFETILALDPAAFQEAAGAFAEIVEDLRTAATPCVARRLRAASRSGCSTAAISKVSSSTSSGFFPRAPRSKISITA